MRVQVIVIRVGKIIIFGIKFVTQDAGGGRWKDRVRDVMRVRLFRIWGSLRC